METHTTASPHEESVTGVEAWSRAELLEQLERMLASRHFSKSKRYPTFLRFVVEQTLLGKTESLKERTLGTDVFNRPSNYDTNADPIVRVTAGEIRKRIAQYYQEMGHEREPRIDLPLGSYVPQFLPPSHAAALGESELAQPPTQAEAEARPVLEIAAAAPQPGTAEVAILPAVAAAGRRPRPRRAVLLTLAAIVAVTAAVLGGVCVAHDAGARCPERPRLCVEGRTYIDGPGPDCDRCALARQPGQ